MGIYNILSKANKNILSDKLEVLLGSIALTTALGLSSLCTSCCKEVYKVYKYKNEISIGIYNILDKDKDGCIEEPEVENLLEEITLKYYLKN